ncbi:hypothetical protein I4U23_001504 [Adineta vaga]|nr:hypothetical protein I4U23_001504 [Adineta vaga]
MFKDISSRTLLIIIIILIGLIYIIYHIYILKPFIVPSYQAVRNHSLLLSSGNEGWISSSLDDQFRSYAYSRKNTIGKITKQIYVYKDNATTPPLNYDYIQYIKRPNSSFHPYSTWKCSNTSVTDFENAGEYCILTNIYYDSSIDQYYFFQDPSDNRTMNQRTKFKTPADDIELFNITDMTFFKSPITAILKRPVLVAIPPDLNYAHGFLETCGPRFWVLAECQSHASYINPKTIQIYYTSSMFNVHPPNWKLYQRRSDGSYQAVRYWERLIHSMFSIYPLLTYKSFDNRFVMFKYMIFPGRQLGRSAAWGYSYLGRNFQSYPLSTVHYRRAYLAYSEWILYHFSLPSKFELTSSQKELQETKQFEQIPLCNGSCSSKRPIISNSNYTGEWIVVLNRRGMNNREIYNADQLVQALLETFPDHSNPYLRVWPEVFYFNDNFYDIVRMSRSIRLLIGVHGAGLANSLFMRPAAILYEINSYGCRDLSFNFRRWAEVFNLQHALWIPSKRKANSDQSCYRETGTEVNIKEIIDEVKNLLKNEIEYRSGYLKRALDIMNDMSIVDYPPTGYENVLS